MNKSVSRSFDIWGYSACVAGAFLLACFQSGFFVNLRPFGAAPDLCLALTAAVALKFGAKKGAVCGFCAGLCLLSLSGGALSLSILFYFSVGVLLGIYAEGKGRVNFAAFLAAFAAVVAASAALAFAELCLTVAAFDIRDVIARQLIPNLAVTLLFSPIPYFLVALFGGKKKEDKR